MGRSLAGFAVAVIFGLVVTGSAWAGVIDVTTNADGNPGSLRAAINTADASGNATDTISFASLPSNQGTITLTSGPLPLITRPGLIIDGTTFSGGRVILDGSGLPGAGNIGLQFTGYVGGSNGGTVRGMEITGFTRYGIDAEASGVTITGNLIGNNGSTAKPNGVGVALGDQHDVIGGTTAGAGNVISGNTGAGVSVIGPYAYADTIQGNVIGLNAARTAALGNGGGGVVVSGGQSLNLGTGTHGGGGGNIIAGNSLFGVQLQSGTSLDNVQGNLIGVNASGTVFGQPTGLDVQSDYNNIGNTFSAPGSNVISGNGTGVLVEGSGTTGNNIAGNLIGFDPFNLGIVGNSADAVTFAAGTSGNTVGGSLGANQIAFKAGEGGVNIGSTDNVASQNSGSGDRSKWIISDGPAPTVTSLGGAEYQFLLNGGAPNSSYSLEIYTAPKEKFQKQGNFQTDGSGHLSTTESVTIPGGATQVCGTLTGPGANAATGPLACVTAPGAGRTAVKVSTKLSYGTRSGQELTAPEASLIRVDDSAHVTLEGGKTASDATGTVKFFLPDGKTCTENTTSVIGEGTLKDGITNAVILNLTKLPHPTGTYTIGVQYSGDAHHSPASSCDERLTLVRPVGLVNALHGLEDAIDNKITEVLKAKDNDLHLVISSDRSQVHADKLGLVKSELADQPIYVSQHFGELFKKLDTLETSLTRAQDDATLSTDPGEGDLEASATSHLEDAKGEVGQLLGPIEQDSLAPDELKTALRDLKRQITDTLHEALGNHPALKGTKLADAVEKLRGSLKGLRWVYGTAPDVLINFFDAPVGQVIADLLSIDDDWTMASDWIFAAGRAHTQIEKDHLQQQAIDNVKASKAHMRQLLRTFKGIGA